MTASSLLSRLLEITPLPPDTVVIDELLAAAAIMLGARKALLASATEVLLAKVDPEQVAELARREDAWRIAVAAAQHVCGQARIGTAKLRAYAR